MIEYSEMHNTKKRVYIIHGWDSSPKDTWFPWLAHELTNMGFSVEIPQMPEPKNPDVLVWADTLKTFVGGIDEETYFIGHSYGAYTVLKYLESLPPDKRVGGFISVGGRIWRDGKYVVNCENIKKVAKKIIGIFSDDDYHVPLEESERFKKYLDAEIIIEHGKGHFSRNENIVELPSVLKSVLKLSGSSELPDRSAVVLYKDGEIILLRRVKNKEEYYALPGGGIEEGESAMESARREIKEELGITINLAKPLFNIVNEGRKEYYFMSIKFEGEPILSDPEMTNMNENNLYHIEKKTVSEFSKLTNFYPIEAQIKIMEFLSKSEVTKF